MFFLYITGFGSLLVTVASCCDFGEFCLLGLVCYVCGVFTLLIWVVGFMVYFALCCGCVYCFDFNVIVGLRSFSADFALWFDFDFRVFNSVDVICVGFCISLFLVVCLGL